MIFFREYLSLRAELEEIETELASILERARCNDRLNTDTDCNGDNYVPQNINQTILGVSTVSSEQLSSIVVAVMNGEDGSKDRALTKRFPKGRSNSDVERPVRCEFSLHEVLSGYARVTRLNGEDPKVPKSNETNIYQWRCENGLFIDWSTVI